MVKTNSNDFLFWRVVEALFKKTWRRLVYVNRVFKKLHAAKSLFYFPTLPT